MPHLHLTTSACLQYLYMYMYMYVMCMYYRSIIMSIMLHAHTAVYPYGVCICYTTVAALIQRVTARVVDSFYKPGDFWLHHDVGRLLCELRRDVFDEAEKQDVRGHHAAVRCIVENLKRTQDIGL